MVVPVDNMNNLNFQPKLLLKWEQYKECFLSDKSEEEIGAHHVTFHTASIVTENLLREFQQSQQKADIPYTDLVFFEYKKVSVSQEMLTPGAKFYRKEGSFTWVLSVGSVNDYAVYVLENCDNLEHVYKYGSKVSRPEAMRMFPHITADLMHRE